ncbi:hypothetical protein JOD24_002075 [Kroppenstedtia sanguinis]
MARIFFDSLKITEISNASGVFTGHNVQYGWRHESKQNEGFGTFSGNGNLTCKGIHILIDSDLIDQWVKKQHDEGH